MSRSNWIIQKPQEIVSVTQRKWTSTKRNKKWTKVIFEQITVGNFPKLLKCNKIHV